MVEVMELAPKVLVAVPTAVAVTSTAREHDPEAGMVPPARLRTAVPAAAVAVPPQVEARLGTAAMKRLAGKVSVKVTPVISAVFGLVRVMVSRLVPSTWKPLLKNDLVTVGADR